MLMILSVIVCLLLFTIYDNNFQNSNQTTGLAWGMLASRRMAERQSCEAGGQVARGEERGSG